MIVSKEIKIPATDNLTSGYIESELEKLSIDPLRWAVVEASETFYKVSVSYVEP